MDARNVDTSAQYESVVNALISHFTRIDKATDTLPLFTAMPWLWLFWASLKFYFALIGDVIFIVPINFVTLLRNILPGRWGYTCWSCKYFKACGNWIWNGECVVPSIYFRPLSKFLLHWHFRNRLSVLRRQLLRESFFSEEGAKAALTKIDRAHAFWVTPSFGAIMLAWVLPLIGPVIEIAKLLLPVNLPGWSNSIAIFTIGYILGILATAFGVKRGLMLGASGHAALYPGLLSGAGGYEREREILQPLGLSLSEFPLDAALLLASLLLGLITYGNEMELMQSMGVKTVESSTANILGRVASPAFFAIVIGIALIRRKKLGRE